MDNIDYIWLLWKQEILQLINTMVPMYCVNSTGKAHPWIDREVKQLARRKKVAWNKAMKTNSDHHWRLYKELNIAVKELIKNKQQNYINRQCNELDRDPKRFWKLLNFKKKEGSLPQEMVYNGNKAVDIQQKVNMFNVFFSSVFNTDTYQYPNIPVYRNDNLAVIDFNVNVTYMYLKSLNVKKSSAPGGVPSMVLKNCALPLSFSLTLIFNKIMECGKIPNEWKLASIFPIYKKDLKNAVDNYRPVSLLSNVGKVFEKCLLQYVKPFIIPSICEEQHGFTQGKSTVTQLCQVYSNIAA